MADVNYVKKIITQEPAVTAWAVNGGLAALLAFIFHFTKTQEASAVTIITGLTTIYTAALAKPPEVSLISGTLTTIATAVAAFGLHLSPHGISALATISSVALALLLRQNLSPKIAFKPVMK
jgi:hypothetical protein